jgi:hypothetical protein
VTDHGRGRHARLVLVRHGQGRANVEGVIAGLAGCAGLTEPGRGHHPRGFVLASMLGRLAVRSATGRATLDPAHPSPTSRRRGGGRWSLESFDDVAHLANLGNERAAPAPTSSYHGDPLRAYLSTPGLRLRLVPLPAYSPDFNADEALWGWVRADVTANTCFGTAANIREHVGAFFHSLADRTDEVQRRCRTVLQPQADAFTAAVQAIFQPSSHVDPTLAVV